VVRTDQTAWRFRQVVDSCRDAFIEFDGDCFITEWSTGAEALLGWTREEMTGRTMFDCVSDPFVEVVEQGMAVLRSIASSDSFASAPVRQGPVVVEMELRRREGTILAARGSVFVTGTGDDVRMGVFVHHSTDADLTLGEGDPSDRLHDQLTGLPNRMLFIKRLTAAISDLRRTPGTVAVVGLGLDRFKAINDALGHNAGDDLLMAVAARLRLAGGGVRPVLSRLGGDEFLALFEDPGGLGGREAESFAERALAALSDPFDVGGSEIFLTASVGIATTSDPEADASTLLSNADAAMHESKAAGGGGLRVFGEAMRRQVVEKLHTEHSLHRALERRELTLYYQPVVDISDGDTVGVEALLRWQHPEHGLMGPDRFIPVAEESGLIIPIGAWVLGEACKQLDHWRQHGFSPRHGTVEVNLSARQVDHPDLVATVDSVLETTGLPPENLTLEITESALMRDAVSALGVLRALKRIGVSLAIDDFGTGYSSLSYLHRFPLDVLKVDKSFIDELDDGEGAEIVAAVVNLAHALGLDVVAEGVETERQLQILRELGCDHAQGYLFSPPVPASDLSAPFSVGAVPTPIREPATPKTGPVGVIAGGQSARRRPGA
jgi:diguanylate cyclase (GGDEF)-like protein/PAS domain S-box-containing protein